MVRRSRIVFVWQSVRFAFKKHFRSRWDKYWMLAKWTSGLWIATLLAFGAFLWKVLSGRGDFAAMLTAWRSSSGIGDAWLAFCRSGDWVSTVSLGFAVVSLVLASRRIAAYRKREQSYFFMPENALDLTTTNLTDDYRTSAYVKYRFGDQVAVYSRDVNRALISSNAGLVWHKRSSYRLLPSVLECAPFILRERMRSGGICWNDRKIRQRTDLLLTNGCLPKNIEFEPTDYFEGEVTNEIAPFEVYRKQDGGADPALVQSGRALYLAGPRHTLIHYTDSQAANYVGVNVLAITRDRHLILQLQSGGNMQSRWRLAPSGSGSADDKDRKVAKGSFRHFIVEAMERELVEETGLDEKRRHEVALTRVIGFARWLNRGARPEYFGLSALRVRRSELRISPGERAFVAHHRNEQMNLKDKGEFVEQLRTLSAAAGPERFSFPLGLGLVLVSEYVESNPDALEEIDKWLSASHGD